MPKTDEARISWDNPDSVPAPGRLGVVADGEFGLALFRIKNSWKHTSEVEILDSIEDDVVTAGMHARLLDDTPSAHPPGQASFFVWSPRSGRSLLVDGKPSGETPRQLLLAPGSHQILLELPAGGRAGAEVEARAGESEYLLLSGKFPEAKDGLGLSYLLDRRERSRAVPPRKSPHLLWLEDGEGKRIYLDCEPVKAPIVRKKVTPHYPEAARKAGISGQVLLYALLGTDGRPSEVQVIAGEHPDLSAAAAEAVRLWVFQPATLDGKPVRMLWSVLVDFYLTR